jgi:hypothetical protein
MGLALDIDRQRIAAVRKLNELGFTYVNGQWMPAVAVGAPPPQIVADTMHAVLVRRADALAGCLEASAEGGFVGGKEICDAGDVIWLPAAPRGAPVGCPDRVSCGKEEIGLAAAIRQQSQRLSAIRSHRPSPPAPAELGVSTSWNRCARCVV